MKRFATIVLCIMAVATMKAQTEVTAGIMRGKDYGVTYMLPQTEIIINVESSKEIDKIIYYLVSIFLGEDLASLLNMIYSKPESGIVIFSNFQNVVAKIYEMNVAFNINKFNTKK